MGFLARTTGRQFEATVRRVNQATDAAVAIVEAQLHGRVGGLEVVVASTTGMWQRVVDAHRPMFGRQDPELWMDDDPPFGTTTITRSGVLVVVNAQTCKGRSVEIDKTLLHELTHAVQFNRPGARELVVRSLANNYGIAPMTEHAARFANRRVAADEREASRMERHHRRLAQTIA